MPLVRPYVLSIAGFDPSGGAGVIADCKTFEQLQCYGFSAVTALTQQTEDAFLGVQWLQASNIIDQLAPLVANYDIKAAKIGLTGDIETLYEVTSWLREKSPTCKIVWDPILKASAGYVFYGSKDLETLPTILSNIDICTPNQTEAFALSKIDNVKEAGEYLSKNTSVVITGNQSEESKIEDLLFTGGTIKRFSCPATKLTKHGSGCVFSAALTSAIALGKSLDDSIAFAGIYVNKLLNSNSSLLGYHS